MHVTKSKLHANDGQSCSRFISNDSTPRSRNATGICSTTFEYFTIADPRPAAAIYGMVKEVFEAGTDIHSHVWTYESFLEHV